MPSSAKGPVVLAIVLVASSPSDAHAGSRFVTEPADAERLAAVRYAALPGDACLAELGARGVPYVAVPGTRGVDTPVRLTGPLRGVSYRVAIGAARPEDDYRTIADCRLLLALDDLSTVLRDQGVVEARYYSMYRKGGVGFVRPGKRHPGARAIDLVSVTLADGATYSVQGDFHPRPATWTCGERASAPSKDTPGARFWRRVVCAMDESKSFNLLLSPNHDWGHRDHLHMEVRSGIRWFLVH
jgi:hypothetical protein